jgi:hypothetical protein
MTNFLFFEDKLPFGSLWKRLSRTGTRIWKIFFVLCGVADCGGTLFVAGMIA